MMRKTTDIRERIAVRAYFAALNEGHRHSPLTYWLHAEAWERQAGIAKRAAAAKKAAATRRANAILKPSPGSRPVLPGLASRAAPSAVH